MQFSAEPVHVAHLFAQGSQSALPTSYEPFKHEHYGLFYILDG
jgi:hypothetical protein